jgi:hypothetical protein
MTSEQVDSLGSRLDAHHLPETNGRMGVCRRCGSQTDGPEGKRHVPNERQLARSTEWIDIQSHASDVARANVLVEN